jgi:hypothetical protein
MVEILVDLNYSINARDIKKRVCTRNIRSYDEVRTNRTQADELSALIRLITFPHPRNSTSADFQSAIRGLS